MKKQFLILMLSFICFQGIGQIMFQKLLNSNISNNVGSHEEYGNSIYQTPDGGYIVEGNSIILNTVLIKMNKYGDTLWTKNYNCYGVSMSLTSDGGYIVTGMTNNDLLSIRKTDSLGNPVWTKYVTVFAGRGNSVKQTNDGGYIITGENFSSDSCDAFIAKFNATGIMQWNKTVGGSSYDGAYSAEQTNTGGYLVVGSTSSYGAGLEDILLINTDSLGTILWTKTIGTSKNETANYIHKTSDNGYIISGKADTSSSSYNNSTLLIKLDSSFNIQWNKTYEGISFGKNYVEQTADGGYITSCGSGAFSLIKTNAIGDTTWTKGFVTSAPTNFASAVHQTTDKGYIITGYAGFGSIWGDIYVLKTDSTGNGLCQKAPSNPAVASLTLTTTIGSPLILSGATTNNLADTVSRGAKDSTICSTQPAAGVAEINKEADIMVYPNPASNQITIEFDASSPNTILEIKNMLGQTIYSEKITGSGKQSKGVDVSKLTEGIYFIQLQSNDKIISRKFVKE